MKKTYQRILLVLMLTITAISGCSNHEEPTNEKEPVSENNESENDPKDSAYVTSEVMTVEETNALTEGQFISAEDITKIPDAAVLESRDLAFIYCYNKMVNAHGEEITQADIDSSHNVAYGKALPADELLVVDKIGVGDYDVIQEFLGIQILPVVNYFKDGDNGYIKFVTYDVYCVNAGYVITQEKLDELNAQR